MSFRKYNTLFKEGITSTAFKETVARHLLGENTYLQSKMPSKYCPVFNVDFLTKVLECASASQI